MKYIKLIAQALLPFIGGNLIGKYAVKNARKDYRQNVKPPLSPPGYIFPIVWPILYVSMGIAYVSAKKKAHNSAIISSVHYTQLGLNFLWSLLYFRYKLRGAAVVESYVLFTAVTTATVTYYQANKTSGTLMLPYVAWSGYASYLATGNWILNKDKAYYSNN
ncbi:TspO/MBR family protein [Staphylococcus durrellii]|uniref:TspO/MBR family protein n=1 Tax=Staphylococcus durrellii TaxID=2781773 RepID=UPI00189D0DED|nr:TspO/MBR family protein [Staphylococcus durrellii]MBF7016004.1 tryptophan-rich sensory protein [Staphylococcus durrellii]